jgi:hypothetical protein
MKRSRRQYVPHKTNDERELEPLNIKVERELKAKLRKVAKDCRRSMNGQILFFLEEGLRHRAGDELRTATA